MIKVEPQPELLPCPFCLTDTIVQLVFFEYTSELYAVLCGACGCSSGHWIEPDRVVGSWNTRRGSPERKQLREKIFQEFSAEDAQVLKNLSDYDKGLYKPKFMGESDVN